MLNRAINFVSRIALGAIAISAMAADTPTSPKLAQQFDETVRPFITRNCIGCHGGEKPAALFNLEVYPTVDSVVQDHPHWALILGRLKAAEMPPKGAPQPSAESRRQVIDWIEAMRSEEAARNAGDPGPVLARRLSNAEYNYTIRDLTGVDIRPTREFPVDPANPAGFDNSGESLSMSPALLNKYLQAAREVGDHMVLTPDGFGFAPHPMLVETDREKYAISRVVDFYYRQPTDYADYFEAAWRYKNRSALGKADMTLADAAKDAAVSSGYLPLVWRLLEGSDVEFGPVAKLRGMWRALPAAGDNLDSLRGRCEAMREFAIKIRDQTALQFKAPAVAGLSATSQPLMNWKLREFAANRRDFDRNALRMASEPPLEQPEVPKRSGLGLGRAAESRAAIVAIKARIGDSDLIVPDGRREQYEAAFSRFSEVFPDAFYISERGRFYPDNSEDKGRLLSAGYHNVMGYFRDDTALIELVLDDRGKAELDGLWDEFDFIADFTKRTWVQYFFNQSGEILGNGRESGSERPSDEAVSATQVINDLRDSYLAKAKVDPGNDEIAQEAIRDHFKRVDETLRSVERKRADAEPRHLEAIVEFAERAYRRPLAQAERADILGYYRSLRDESGLTHEEAIRDSVVSVLMSPDFCYRVDLLDSAAEPAPAVSSSGRPLSPYGLANRLSYFLWSSMPDKQLLSHAASGDLHNNDVLLAQTRRMLTDERMRGLATEFAGNWLDFRRFEQHNGVDRERFPTFDDELRRSMFEEPIRFVTDVIGNDRSVLNLLYGDYTFANPALARHYDMPEIKGGSEHWVRVEKAGQYGRGGLLPMSVFLTKNSPGLRTSPVQRGYWVVRRVLGETIPPPPPVVPELPEDESKSELSVRDTLASHRSNQVCASCHQRFDSFGLAFESYGPVGEKRTLDLAGRPVDTNADFPDGSQGSGFEGVLAYIRERRQDDYLDNLSRKILAYALSRSLQLSDELVVEKMKSNLAANGHRFSSLIETIVTSPQFLNKQVGELSQNKASQKNVGE
jgi:mono/diheme cytochrome c family protein